ncbi:MAG: 1-deoxy-D-xylulose-5-phosphate reductoisomerase, partial [Simkaniaceae bacterium]|nr:1-deoxy-D-xylulose-5-phosphate reductoisomerase [Simkaniaceae bacterium]
MRNKNIAILGSTGSIGQNTLNVARNLGSSISVRALAARSNIDLLEKQIAEFHPCIVAVFEEEKAEILQARVPHVKIVSGLSGLVEVATEKSVDLVVSAMVGTVGILPTARAIESSKNIALANKEVMVSAGEYIREIAEKKGVDLLPIDSEHSAIFQCLQGEKKESVRRLILTASGGPFRNFSKEMLENVTIEDALKHPSWSMGAKNTIDSSTLMNKGLEVIEAHYLFSIPLSKIDVIIHPQSVIHSFVEMVDGSMLAQLSKPNMMMPIQYALTFPERVKGSFPLFDFKKYASLDFFEPEHALFPCLNLAYVALKKGGSLPAYMNAANEILVAGFLE